MIAKATMAPTAMSVSDVAVFMVSDPFIKDRAGLVSSARRSACRRAGSARRGQGGGQSGEQDVEAAFEFGGAVVAGQDGGQAAEQGEVSDRQPVQAEPEQGIGFVGADGEFLELVEDVTVQEAEQGPVDVQGVGSANPARVSRVRMSSRGRRVPRGRSASGVASGRVTISGTTWGWASASAR